MNKKIYPTGVIKTKDGKIDICLTLQNEINWMKEMRSRLRKPVPVSKSLLNSVELQVRAAEIANEGITAEYESGVGRTTLEVIQSNSFFSILRHKLHYKRLKFS